MDDDLQPAKLVGLTEELAGLRALTAQLRSENARLLRLLELTPRQAAPPGPAQSGFFEAHPGPVDQRSAPEVKVDFFAALFAARSDIYATRWENVHADKSGWLPAVRGGWRKGIRHENRDYLPLAARSSGSSSCASKQLLSLRRRVHRTNALLREEIGHVRTFTQASMIFSEASNRHTSVDGSRSSGAQWSACPSASEH